MPQPKRCCNPFARSNEMMQPCPVHLHLISLIPPQVAKSGEKSVPPWVVSIAESLAGKTHVYKALKVSFFLKKSFYIASI